jgi:hypothetical protein
VTREEGIVNTIHASEELTRAIFKALVLWGDADAIPENERERLCDLLIRDCVFERRFNKMMGTNRD